MAKQRKQPTSIDPREYLRVGTACRIMGITRAYLNRLIARGDVSAVTIDGQNFVRRSVAEAYRPAAESQE